MFISESIDFSYHLNEKFKQRVWFWSSLSSLSLDCAYTSSLNTCYYESCNSLLIITLFKVTELRKRAVKEQKVSIEVPKREPPAAKGVLCFD